tara:strand:- start:384 stop:617 length:234 start_codon:yes stop_codon:yes gene_type:complete
LLIQIQLQIIDTKMVCVYLREEEATKHSFNGRMAISGGIQPPTSTEKLFWSTLTRSELMMPKKNKSVATAWAKTKKK